LPDKDSQGAAIDIVDPTKKARERPDIPDFSQQLTGENTLGF
jgi:hypothetical protein